MTLKKALEIINACTKESRDRFNIDFVTCDFRRQKFGKLRQFKNCRVAGADHNALAHGTINVLHNGSLHEQTVHIHLIMKLNGEFIEG